VSETLSDSGTAAAFVSDDRWPRVLLLRIPEKNLPFSNEPNIRMTHA
jgi:hypothetical protein